MQSVISNVRHNSLSEPIKRVALERRNIVRVKEAPFSIYRDILFLAFTVLGSGNINLGNIFIIILKLDDRQKKKEDYIFI